MMSAAPIAAAESSTMSAKTWDHYRIFLRMSLATGVTTRREVSLNLIYAKRAVRDWAPACLARDKTKLEKIVDYAEQSLQKQLPYGISYFASDFRSELVETRKLLEGNRCADFQSKIWMTELKKTQAEVL